MPLNEASKNKKQLSIFDNEWLGMKLNKNHELYRFKEIIDYNVIENIISRYYKVNSLGRPKHEGVVLCMMLIIQSMNKLSDEKAAKAFSENPYYQNLCGFQYFQNEYKISSTAILRFRKSLGEEGLKELLQYSIQLAIEFGIIKKKTLKP